MLPDGLSAALSVTTTTLSPRETYMYGRSTHESVPSNGLTLEAGLALPISGANHQEVCLEDHAIGLAAAVVAPASRLDGRPRSREGSQAERERLYEETSAAADRIAAEAHSKLPRPKAAAIGAIYVRFSTLFQDSAVDQIRELYQFAVENKIFVPREYVFFDLGVGDAKISGRVWINCEPF
jgi:hypothetical protein